MEHTKKKKKPEVNTWEDVFQLPVQEQKKWEVARELGLFDQIIAEGWKSLTSRQSGKIGGILSSRSADHKPK